jgi:S-adenosylmethionine hydrolase
MDWPEHLDEVIYIDHFGNVMTGLSAHATDPAATILVGEYRLSRATTFADVNEGDSFWYANSSGLVEIATNRGRAADQLGVSVGDPVRVGD